MNTSLESEMDALDNLFEDVDIFVDSEESSLWDKLITQIMEGNVIPVIGADIEYVTDVLNVVAALLLAFPLLIVQILKSREQAKLDDYALALVKQFIANK